MNNRHVFAAATLGLALALGACSTTTADGGGATSSEKRASIDADVNGALTKLYSQDPDSRAMVARARGVLVFPRVVSAGLVVGGSYGQGALLVGGQPVGYYSTTAGSVGLLAGADSKAVYILFMTDESLNKFRASNGWTAGADASISLVKTGASASIDTQTGQQPVVGYVLTNAGLMANLALDGTKISRLNI